MTIRSIVDALIRAVGCTPAADTSQRVLVSGKPVPDDDSHTELKPNGQQRDYVVLSEAERARGFVRPVRRSYRHVGPPGPQYPLRDLTPDEHRQYDQFHYVKFEKWPPDKGLGRYWTQAGLDKVGQGCGVVTTMGQAIAETYAREPSFYGATFCAGCGVHLPVGAQGEFVWDGTDERVGT